jgi:hypothetical protein
MWIWGVWIAFAVALLCMMMYRVSITRNEEDRLFLDDGNEVQHHEQDEIFSKLKRMRPAFQIVGGIEGLITLTIAGLYLTDALRQF